MALLIGKQAAYLIFVVDPDHGREGLRLGLGPAEHHDPNVPRSRFVAKTLAKKVPFLKITDYVIICFMPN